MITYKGYKIYADNSHYAHGQVAARTEKNYTNGKFVCYHDCFTTAIEFVRAVIGQKGVNYEQKKSL